MIDHALPTAPHPTLSAILLLVFFVIQAADVAVAYVDVKRADANWPPRQVFAGLGFWPGAIILKGGLVVLVLLAHRFVAVDYWLTGPLDLVGALVLFADFKVLRAQ